MEAYKEFAQIYDSLVNSDIDYKKWGNKILELCGQYNIQRDSYLDLACGTGNITAVVAPYFKNCYGIDMSNDMLLEADEKLRKLRLKTNLVCQDMRSLNLNRKFDLITCCLDSLNYILSFDDLQSIFRSVHMHLNDGGLLIFDMNSYYKLSEIIGDNTFIHNSEDIVYIWENNFENEISNMYLTFFVKDGDHYTRFEEEHQERAYKDKEIEDLLESCSFVIKNKMDNYLSEKTNNETERIVYIVKKKLTTPNT
jgi:ubiquinone/menaquinone biosynthesis C-methylase UbiE